MDRFFFRFLTIHALDRRTEFSSPDPVCIPCSAVKIKTSRPIGLLYIAYYTSICG